jgi:hypothetical protein
LSKPEIHPLNCSIYSLNDILVSRGFKPTLEEISVLTLTVDLMNNIIKPGDPKLKTSLLAMASRIFPAIASLWKKARRSTISSGRARPRP